MKEELNGKSAKVTANPSPFIQHKVNLVENILYDESASVGEYPIVRISGGSHLEDPEGLLSQKKKKPKGKDPEGLPSEKKETIPMVRGIPWTEKRQKEED
nr:hypothetical protein CFP56_66074 [Quercus suber]